jgi:hypothetical protein
LIKVAPSPPLAVPSWLHVPLDAPGFPWFWPAMIALLAVMFGIIFFYEPGNPGNSPPSDLHKDN